MVGDEIIEQVGKFKYLKVNVAIDKYDRNH